MSVGQKLNLTIVNVDAERKRLGLSIISSGNISEESEVSNSEETEVEETDLSENSDSDDTESSKESE